MMVRSMVTVTGVRIPGEKPLYLSLTYLYGVGRRTAISLCVELGLDPQMRAGRLSQEEIARLSRRLDEGDGVQGALRRSPDMKARAT